MILKATKFTNTLVNRSLNKSFKFFFFGLVRMFVCLLKINSHNISNNYIILGYAILLQRHSFKKHHGIQVMNSQTTWFESLW